jgi:hypothetical protein
MPVASTCVNIIHKAHLCVFSLSRTAWSSHIQESRRGLSMESSIDKTSEAASINSDSDLLQILVLWAKERRAETPAQGPIAHSLARHKPPRASSSSCVDWINAAWRSTVAPEAPSTADAGALAASPIGLSGAKSAPTPTKFHAFPPS